MKQQAFEAHHEARWNDILSRMEMHLVAQRDVRFKVAERSFHFKPGQSIHTENSHKYGPRGGRVSTAGADSDRQVHWVIGASPPRVSSVHGWMKSAWSAW